MKVLKKILLLAVILAVVVAGNEYIFGSYYNNSSLYGSFAYKARRAAAIEENKTIFIGGSSVNLGIDSQHYEEQTGEPAVNFGISAAVPLRVYMKAAEEYAHAGDKVVIPLEYEYYGQEYDEITEAYIDMIGVDPTLKCKDTLWGNIDYLCNRFLRSFARLNDCFIFLLRDVMNVDTTIYIADSVNEYGDFCLHEGREQNYVREKMGKRTFSYDEDVFLQLNTYIEKMEEKGVAVYITYPPTDGLRYDNHEEYFGQAQRAVEEHIPPENIVGTPFDFIYDETFFYDTAYHVQYENRAEYTQALCMKLAQQVT